MTSSTTYPYFPRMANTFLLVTVLLEMLLLRFSFISGRKDVAHIRLAPLLRIYGCCASTSVMIQH